MKKVILLALFMPVLAYGQIMENFESGEIINWIQYPEGRWKADSSNAISGIFSLHHVFDNSDAGADRIGIPIKNLYPSMGTTKWSFCIRHGYDPSSSNNWVVFLMSDSEPALMSPDCNGNAFVLGVNFTGQDDTLRLWKLKQKVLTKVVDCRINWQTQIGSAIPVKIIVERTKEGNWTVSVYTIQGSLIGISEGSEKELFSPLWFGIFYRYTSTKDRLLWFDDLNIEGYFYEDKEAPIITQYEVTGKKSLEITLNEEVTTEFITSDNFYLKGDEDNTISVVKQDGLKFTVSFGDELINKTINSLIINNICDKSGNCSSNIKLDFTPVCAEAGDVIISEIMADPLPEVSLPGKEYLEITNRTKYSFNLKNWKLFSDNQNYLIPEVIMKPAEIRILCQSKDTSLFKSFGNVTGLNQFPSLTDEGKTICIADSSGTLIHGVDYSSDWYGDKLKSLGGWSLEMIDINYPFYDSGNWKASSSHLGGTPGSGNSVSSFNPDTSFYGIQNVFPEDSMNIIVRFSEPVINLPKRRADLIIDDKMVQEIIPVDLLYGEFLLKPEYPLVKGVAYQLDISDSIKDFARNVIKHKSFLFGLPEMAAKGDILFNELLFNPLPGDPDYLELYNSSEKIIDASRLQLVSINTGTGAVSQSCSVSSERRCIVPGSYYAITTDRTKISDRYFSGDPDRLFETACLPAMEDDTGHIILYNRELDIIDEVSYSENMHDSGIKEREGVALGKSCPDSASMVSSNWYSASESSGRGTPGAKNSFNDNEAPAVVRCEVLGRKALKITFNEEPSGNMMIPENISLNSGENKPVSVKKEKQLTYLIEFSNVFINRSLNTLIINNLCDRAGNCGSNVQIPFTPGWPETGDVIISEIMANPLPEVSLPGKVYIELTNRTEYSFNMKSWKLLSDGRSYLFPGKIIGPSGVIIICQARDTSLFIDYGGVAGLEQFPSLTEAGKLICLSDSANNLIHGVEYSSSWYGDKIKSEGGWSIEMVDTRFPFNENSNWKASVSRSGGSPGSRNSVSSSNPDTSFYGIENVFSEDSFNIAIKFSEPVIGLPILMSQILIGGKTIRNIVPTDLLYREFMIKSEYSLAKGVVYQLNISDSIKDFAGNVLKHKSFVFGLPEMAAKGDILFNELLFNPLPGEPDYLEFYNASEKIIDASSLQLVSINTGNGAVSQSYPVSSERRGIVPGSYYAITTDRKKVSEQYFSGDPDRLFETDYLPAMEDDTGHLILYNRELDIIDEVSYNEDMHDPVLIEREGVALEKTDPHLSSEVALNWFSASESSGRGTPGAKNSFKDNEAPEVIRCEVLGRKALKITINEEPAGNMMIPENFSLNSGENKPVSVKKGKQLTYLIEFSNVFIDRSLNILIINNLCDRTGNCNSYVQIPFTPVWPERGDIIISEIMANPLPEVSLPGKEYIELTNRTEYSFNMKKCELSMEGKCFIFPEAIIGPFEIFIICSDKDTSLFKEYGKVAGLTQFPSLTETGKLLCLSDSIGNLIYGVEYSSAWYGDELKSEGGWSLEMVDVGFPFYDNGNWKASVSRWGGTPGSSNSVSVTNPDYSFHGILNVFAADSNNINVTFSEPVFAFPEEINCIKIDGQEIESIIPTDLLYREFRINPGKKLTKGTIYKLEISDSVKDFAGNRIQNPAFVFGLPGNPEAGEVLFNELLFNPLPGDPDYLEFYNASENVIDAASLQLVSVNDDTGVISQLYKVSDENRCILPAEYYAVTIDREKVSERYVSSDPQHIFQITSLPSMADDQGHLILYNRELGMIDEVLYNEKMHYSLLSGYEGVSLEKINPLLESEEPANWHSASESSGWGTPGASNSIYSEIPVSSDNVNLSSSKITPDNDGTEDYLIINFNLTGNGNVISVSVFDEMGRIVKKIAINMLAGSDTTLIWDGTAQDGTLVNSGIYIILITFYDDKGKTEKWKKVCTVIRN